VAKVGTHFHRLLEDPHVFSICGPALFDRGFSACVKEAKGEPFYVLVLPRWWIPDVYQRLSSLISLASAKHPEANFTIASQTRFEDAFLKKNGTESIYLFKNAFIDETIFCPVPNIDKEFAAVHNATLQPYKRHDLAWGVQEIAVITYMDGVGKVIDASMLRGYNDLKYCNYSLDGTGRLLADKEVSEVICRSRCGLILSALEGCANASMEYLLCGVPVVSTPSIGGRDQFFDQQTAIIVPPEPAAIEAAVVAMDETVTDPIKIREITLNKTFEHRIRLISWLSNISGKDLMQDANTNYWIPPFCDKLREWVLIEQEDLIVF
jgi:glycosyltransferase involved in cell wall biosynthesis